MFSQLFAAALLAATVSCSPIASSVEIIESRALANCTEYASTAAGAICVDLPSDCTARYIVQPGDTCQSIGALFNNFTLSEFYYWNPDIGQTCFGLDAYWPVCINTPWYTFVPPVQASTGTVESASALPVPIMPGIVSNCTTFEYVGDGETVDAILAQNGITLDQFVAWNTDVDATNPSVWADYWVCVGA